MNSGEDVIGSSAPRAEAGEGVGDAGRAKEASQHQAR